MKEPVRRRSGTINKCDKREIERESKKKERKKELVLDERERGANCSALFLLLVVTLKHTDVTQTCAYNPYTEDIL